VAACLLATGSAPALLNIDGTRNQVFVFGGVTFGYSSNIFAEAGGAGDTSFTSQAGLELKRRAGLIAVDSTLKFDYIAYSRYTGENSLNPNFLVELTKTNGRTTGSFRLNAYRETRSDSAVNLRTSSWNIPLNLSLKYPLNEKFYVTSDTNYLRRTYQHDQGLVNYSDYSEAVDLYYTYTSKLDLLGGYRVRFASTSANGRTVDHWFNVGATGGLFTKLTGTVRLGYQIRQERRPVDASFNHFNATALVNWPLTRKLRLGLQLNRDFSTIATGNSVDSTSAMLQAGYTYSRKIEFSADAGGGHNKFLGTNPARRDTFFSFSAGAGYTANEHLRVGARYSYLHNWSTLALSDFESHGFSLEISSHY
jgi:hypothetical protein